MKLATEQARAYLAKIPPAVSGSGGHNATLRAACELARFGLYESDAMALLTDWNQTHCQPPWTEPELLHKWRAAQTKVGSPTRLAAHPASIRTVWKVERKTWAPLPVIDDEPPKNTEGQGQLSGTDSPAPKSMASKPAAKIERVDYDAHVKWSERISASEEG